MLQCLMKAQEVLSIVMVSWVTGIEFLCSVLNDAGSISYHVASDVRIIT